MQRTRSIVAAVALAFAASIPAYSAEPAWLDLAAAIERVESSYPGRVVAAQLDPSRSYALHYHVDVLLPGGNVAAFAVDSLTGRISNRPGSEQVSATDPAAGEAVRRVQAATRGRVLAVEYDADPAPHYHVHVRLRDGDQAKVHFDLASGTIDRSNSGI